MRSFILATLKNRILQHLLFWVLSFCFIAFYFAVSNQITTIDFIYALFFHIPLFLVVYGNLYVAILFLKKEYYLVYGLILLVLILLAYGLHELVFDNLIPLLAPGYYIVSFIDFYLLTGIFILYILLTSLLKLSRSWFELQRIQQERTLWELESLRSQINPHFLLNSLNTIYGLTLQNNPEAPDAVLKLSELIKHMLYSSKAHVIPLKDEINYVNNYIDLQRMRLSAEVDIEFSFPDDVKDYSVPPLLLVTFVENSFKHGRTGEKDDYFHFNLKIQDTTFTFTTQNKYNSSSGNVKPKSGIGLENILRRLELIYGSGFSFQKTENDNTFIVKLEIKHLDKINLPQND